MSFDIVICLGPNDKNIILKQIEYTKKNILKYRHIYIISFDSTLLYKKCITIDENIFPFTINDVVKYHGLSNRNGWYLQQLLKLYAGIIIPNILDTYLVIDADTFFLKPTTFIQDTKCLYNFGTEYYNKYFEHMNKLHLSLTKYDNKKSGICHHMMFETKYVKKLFKLIETHHNDIFWKLFLKYVDITDISGASEYEIYFNYMLLYNRHNIRLRKLKWTNISRKVNKINKSLDYVSYHHWL